jgi:hypothetical protein
MFWQKIGTISADCFMVAIGLAIATPFFLVMSLPFVGGL